MFTSNKLVILLSIATLGYLQLGYAIDCSLETVNSLFPSTFYLEGQACEGLWHHNVKIKESDNTKDEIGRFRSLCPSFNQDIQLLINDESLGKTDKQTAFQWGTSIDIYDCNGNIMYVVEEGDLEVILNSITIKTQYNIYNTNSNGKKQDQIGFSEKTEFFDTKIEIKNMDNIVIATSEKSLGDKIGASFCVDPSWKTDILIQNDPLSDPRIISFIVSLKEVQDLGKNDYDSCTGFVIFGYVLLGIVCLLILGGVGFFIYVHFFQ